MFFLLLFSFVMGSSFEWQEVEYFDAKSITRQIKNSSIVASYGEENLKKKLTYFDDDVFECGNKLILPEGARIIRMPDGFEVSKTDIKIIKHERYAVTYKEGWLKDEWQRLVRESASKMGVSSLDNLTVEQVMQIKSRISSGNHGVRKSKRVNRVVRNYPERIYISFILIEIDGQDKLLPVVLAISPIQDLLDGIEGI